MTVHARSHAHRSWRPVTALPARQNGPPSTGRRSATLCAAWGRACCWVPTGVPLRSHKPLPVALVDLPQLVQG